MRGAGAGRNLASIMKICFAIETYRDALQAVLSNRVASLLVGRIPRSEPAAESAAFLIGEILGHRSSHAHPSHWMERIRQLLEKAKETVSEEPFHDLVDRGVSVWASSGSFRAGRNDLSDGILAYLSEDAMDDFGPWH